MVVDRSNNSAAQEIQDLEYLEDAEIANAVLGSTRPDCGREAVV